MNKVVIVSAVRTPIGSFGGALKALSAVDLGVIAVKGALEKINLSPSEVDEVVFGNVLSAGLGQNVARQVAVKSGLNIETPAMTINKVCGSGLRAVSLGAQMIRLDDAKVVVCGGTESMSNAPYVLNNSRWGMRMGDSTVVDTIIKDGLSDAFSLEHMGMTAENLAEKYSISREEQDKFAYESQMKAAKAREEGKFVGEIIPVEIKDRKGNVTVVSQDEYIKPETTVEKLGKLRPAFKKDGTVTAGNASGINDGAACIILMSEEKAKSLCLKPLAEVVSYASAGVDPNIMGYGPVPATLKALEKANLNIKDIDLIEANEAFASQAISVSKGLEFNNEIVNVNGGAIALGHPIGASGARILVSLLHEMDRRDSQYGLATLCIGGGQGTSVIIKRL